MKTMAPMIAAKNMAGKERVDSSMLPTCSLRASVHNAIVCANRKFCWQRLLYGKATARGMEAAPRVGGVSKLWRKQALLAFPFGLAALRDFHLGKAAPKVFQDFSPANFAVNSDLKPSPFNLTPSGSDRL